REDHTTLDASKPDTGRCRAARIGDKNHVGNTGVEARKLHTFSQTHRLVRVPNRVRQQPILDILGGESVSCKENDELIDRPLTGEAVDGIEDTVDGDGCHVIDECDDVIAFLLKEGFDLMCSGCGRAESRQVSRLVDSDYDCGTLLP